MAWKKGPLPADTWNWGGVVPKGEEGGGFYFADFCGDHVEVVGATPARTLKADEVAYYDNCLELPAHETGRAGSAGGKP